MGMPSISISFTELAASAIKRGEKGIVALIINDANVPSVNPVVCTSDLDVPTSLSATTQEQIKLALKGYVNQPKKVIAYIVDGADYTNALNYLKTVKFDYLVAPSCATDEQTSIIASYVKAERANKKLIKAVLPNTKSDYEGIINYTTEKVFNDDKEYTTEQYCGRIAGIIAGTPFTIAATYAPLPELTDCTRLSKDDMDKAVDNGEFIVWFDGEKVKTARAVNSFVTTTDEKKAQFKKIKIIDIMDLIDTDIHMAAEDTYIGKYSNGYDNRVLVLSAIDGYFSELERKGILGKYEIDFDVEAIRNFLKSKGINVDEMDDNEIKRSDDVGSYVFLKSRLWILDAIEDIKLPINI